MSRKYCPKCMRNKRYEEFSMDMRRADGLNYYCRECVAAKYRDDYLSKRTSYAPGSERVDRSRQYKIVKHGLEVVEAMEASCYSSDELSEVMRIRSNLEEAE